MSVGSEWGNHGENIRNMANHGLKHEYPTMNVRAKYINVDDTIANYIKPTLLCHSMNQENIKNHCRMVCLAHLW